MNTKTIILGLTSTELPTIQEWGNKRHVPINIVEETIEDENGNPQKQYTYDVIERVEQPINYANIMKAAVNSCYTEDEQKYIMANLALLNNPKVEEYKEFTSNLSQKIIASGYNPE